MCHQTVCLIARHLEAAGIPTLVFASALDIVEAGKPPRAVFTDYPLGHSVGRPNDRNNQSAIVMDGLKALETISTPGQIQHLSYEWSESGDWKSAEADEETGDTRSPRGTEPVYQTESDRLAAEG